MQKAKSKFDILRHKIHIVVHGTNTVAGRLFDKILLGLILLSVLLVMMETVQDFNQKYHEYLVFFEWVITILFSIEYILRVISINKPFRYIFSFYGIIDLIAVLPMYLTFLFSGASILTIIRAFRLLRLFKILNHPKFSSQSVHLKKALLASKGKIIVFLYFV
ncbi:MAG: ion transporter, partial [Flavobacterium sp.]